MNRPTRSQARWLLALAVAGLVLSVLLEQLTSASVRFSADAVSDRIESFGALAPLAFIALMAIAVVVTPIPSVPLDIAAGILFGWFWGTIYVLIGAELGAAAAFLLARRFARPWVERRLGATRIAHISEAVERNGAQLIFVMRLIPAFHFDWVSYAAGLTSMRIREYLLATLFGMVLPVMAIVAVGAQLSTRPVLSAGIFIVLVCFAFAPLAWWSIITDSSETA